mmetsp:Transcript_37499/g.94661  ORF Transcript_37499/g.94661 Transcript_37499/m.94661 type:complete len:222 (+) Transcript_37499:895-1560(+)
MLRLPWMALTSCPARPRPAPCRARSRWCVTWSSWAASACCWWRRMPLAWLCSCLQPCWAPWALLGGATRASLWPSRAPSPPWWWAPARWAAACALAARCSPFSSPPPSSPSTRRRPRRGWTSHPRRGASATGCRCSATVWCPPSWRCRTACWPAAWTCHWAPARSWSHGARAWPPRWRARSWGITRAAAATPGRRSWARCPRTRRASSPTCAPCAAAPTAA